VSNSVLITGAEVSENGLRRHPAGELYSAAAIFILVVDDGKSAALEVGQAVPHGLKLFR
jgi:hypothetical protein